MRGIFSSFLPLVLALLLMQAAAAQNVTIDLTPITTHRPARFRRIV